ncbi:vesicle associated membrane protein 2 [Rhinolophus ferrumequinum]|uniref:Vesicle associated membrane protein 2 n=1 Tax=Rhinolophus ferrumequinum TaxID=59479 RepID=A0A7J7TH39_RHIFE|nr:vesicle associated membrane protein 2 [Rhinolophus ferrumequinum]
MSATAATAPPAAPAGEGGPPGPPPNLTSNRRLQQTQAQVDEVVDIMRVNVDKVLERDQKLSELDDRADALQAGASQLLLHLSAISSSPPSVCVCVCAPL